MTEINYASIYKERVDKSREELEKQIHYITEKTIILANEVRRGEEAKEELEQKREELMKWTKMYSDMKGELM